MGLGFGFWGWGFGDRGLGMTFGVNSRGLGHQGSRLDCWTEAVAGFEVCLVQNKPNTTNNKPRITNGKTTQKQQRAHSERGGRTKSQGARGGGREGGRGGGRERGREGEFALANANTQPHSATLPNQMRKTTSLLQTVLTLWFFLFDCGRDRFEGHEREPDGEGAVRGSRRKIALCLAHQPAHPVASTDQDSPPL